MQFNDSNSDCFKLLLVASENYGVFDNVYLIFLVIFCNHLPNFMLLQAKVFCVSQDQLSSGTL